MAEVDRCQNAAVEVQLSLVILTKYSQSVSGTQVVCSPAHEFTRWQKTQSVPSVTASIGSISGTNAGQEIGWPFSPSRHCRGLGYRHGGVAVLTSSFSMIITEYTIREWSTSPSLFDQMAFLPISHSIVRHLAPIEVQQAGKSHQILLNARLRDKSLDKQHHKLSKRSNTSGNTHGIISKIQHIQGAKKNSKRKGRCWL